MPPPHGDPAGPLACRQCYPAPAARSAREYSGLKRRRPPSANASNPAASSSDAMHPVIPFSIPSEVFRSCGSVVVLHHGQCGVRNNGLGLRRRSRLPTNAEFNGPEPSGSTCSDPQWDVETSTGYDPVPGGRAPGACASQEIWASRVSIPSDACRGWSVTVVAIVML